MNESNNDFQPRIDYDGLWKRLILAFFEEFLAFFLPDLLPEVDLNKPPEFLEQELSTIMPKQTAKGRMSVDKLLKFWTKSGEDKHVFVHIEIQSSRELGFTERAFKYFYRIYDREGKLITTIVVYTHDDVPKRYDRFEYNYQGTELIYKFNTYLVRDADEQELKASDNIFALAILACKYTNQTKNDVELRRKFKLNLFRLAVNRGHSRQQIEALMAFIDYVVSLPPELNQALKIEFKKEKLREMKSIEKDYIISPTFDEIFFELMDEKIAFLTKKVEEQERTVEEQRKVAEEQRKAVEEQRKAAEEQKKASVRKLLKIKTMQVNEVADIIGISIEEVLKIKAELDAQN